MGPVNLQHYLVMYCFHIVQYFKMFIIYYLSWNSKEGKKKKKKYVFQENTTTGDILGSSSESTVQILLHWFSK